MTIYIMVCVKIIRHSERYDYTNPIKWVFSWGGYWADSPLTEKGHEMAYAKGKDLLRDGINPHTIYTSPYIRTISTANEIKRSFTDSDIIFEPLLAEYQPLMKHTTNLYPRGLPTASDGYATPFKYPETYTAFQKRAVFIMEKLMQSNTHDFIAITHGEFLRAYIAYLQDRYPAAIPNVDDIPYLTELSFEYDYSLQEIDEYTIDIKISVQ